MSPSCSESTGTPCPAWPRAPRSRRGEGHGSGSAPRPPRTWSAWRQHQDRRPSEEAPCSSPCRRSTKWLRADWLSDHPGHRFLAARGESPTSHRDELVGPPTRTDKAALASSDRSPTRPSRTRRDNRKCCLFVREEQEWPRGCVARRMPTDFHHGLLASRIRSSPTYSARGIPFGGVAPSSNILGRRAWPLRAPRPGIFVTELLIRDTRS